MMRPRRLVAILILMAGPAPVWAADAQRPEIVGVRVGLAGRYKPGLWTPVEVKLRGADRLQGPQVTLTVPDGDGVPSRVSAPVPSPDAAATEREVAADETSVILYARLGRVKSELAVELSSTRGVVQHRVFQVGKDSGFQRALLSDQELVVTVSRAPLGVEQAVRLLHQAPEEKTVVVRLDDFRQLPTQWYGYEGVSTVVLSTSDPQIYADLKPAGPRVSALDEWVRMGGRLIFSAGERAGEVLGRQPRPLAQFAPGRFEKMVSLPLAGALEAYCGSSAPIRVPTAGIPAPYLADVQGTIELREGTLPLVVRRPWGFGQIVFIAVDLDRPPLADWEDRGRLVGMLLDHADSPADEDDETTAIMHYGFTDLAGQLRSALDQFPRVPAVSFWLVAGLIVVYILAIGPGDYFLLRKVVRRMPWTWVTFPVIVVTFGLLAYVLAVGLKGDRVRLNQIDLVDVDLETGRLRGTAWANVFSPRMQRYDLVFRPQPPGGQPARSPGTLTAWLGLPGDALGGMNPRTLEPKIWRHHYDFSARLDELRGVPIQVGSTKSLTARWAMQVVPPVKARLAQVDRLPEGTITNTLPCPLTECLLAYGKYAYELGTIESGESVPVGPSLRLRELRSILTGLRFVRDGEKESYRQQVTQYDRASVDVAYILRAMMFYEEADGRQYTGLSNRYQGFVDLSHLLKTGRAVLVGRAQAGTAGVPPYAAELLVNGQAIPPPQVRHTALYRFVIPVEPEAELLGASE